MESHNPYKPPGLLKKVKRKSVGRPSRWLFAFLLNFPVPIFFGAGLCEGAASTGMTLGVTLLGVLGWTFCSANPRFINCFALGTVVVAAGQFIPVLQVFSGVIAIHLVAFFSPTLNRMEPVPMLAFHDGLMVTLIAGGLLALVALSFGLFFRHVWPATAKRAQRPRSL